MQKIALNTYFDDIITSADMGCPKEDLRYWQNAHSKLSFDNNKTLFIDDTPECIDSAQRFGIKYCLVKDMANSKRHEPSCSKFLSFKDFSELLP
ncbi:HAD family hydrolase [Candidatus Omnitrophus magneticus]|uniref:HAD family hydrolase n=1 Tax=Candidatus Omnitrophus magneticus TaxID=1609969 RepID=A0A0F0CQA9_9BACT|nr:HAD family hydrolase [Candidatus Omnitrophus magneticus]